MGQQVNVYESLNYFNSGAKIPHKVAVVNISAANIQVMYANPVLVLAGVADKMISVDSIDFVMTRTGTNFTAGGQAKVQYGNTYRGGGITIGYIHTNAAPVIIGSEKVVYTSWMDCATAGKDADDVMNVGLYISNLTSAFATGTGTGVLTISYHLV